MIKKILITGSLAFDYIMDFPQTFEENIIPEKLKTLSVSFLVHKFSKNFGGVAGNIAYNIALFGLKPSIISIVGKKDFAPYAKHLRKISVDISSVKQMDNEFTANAFIITDKNNCQITGFYPGESRNEQLSITNSQSLDFIVIAPDTPVNMDNFVNQAKNLDVPYLYDPAQQIPRLTINQLKNGIEGAEIIIGNDYEIALVTKKTGITKKQMLQKKKIVVTTLGAKGSLIETINNKYFVGIIKLKSVVDPTGAGDAYIAGLIAGYLKCYSLLVCGQIGATAASYAIEHYGTQNHKFSLSDFKKRYQKAFKKSVDL